MTRSGRGGGWTQCADGLLCLVQTASLLRDVCRGEDIIPLVIQPQARPVSQRARVCFSLILSHPAASLWTACLVRWWPCLECSKCSVTHMACPRSIPLRSSSRNFQPSFSLPCIKFGQHFSDRHNWLSWKLCNITRQHLTFRWPCIVIYSCNKTN